MNIEKASVVIIGGGVVGCSILYHLAKRGMKDVILLERQELTSGASWHAAGNLAALTMPSNAASLHKYTIDLYPELQEESGQHCGVHIVGGLYLSRDSEQSKQLQRLDSQAKRNGIETAFITPKEAQEFAPILNTDGIESILYETIKGYCDPAGVTNAFAKAAKNYGATVKRFTPVIKTIQTPSGGWEIHTNDSIIHADAVVNAAGLWGREVAALAGIQLPLMPVEHHYFVTESIPEIEALSMEVSHISEPGGGYYMRQEGKGLLLGIYEKKCTLWAVDGTPLDFGHELLTDDLSRADEVIEFVMNTIPCMQTAGIKRVVNGPMIFSPDLAPLVGPHPALRNYYCAAGVMAGFNQGGGIGKILTEWIMDGEPGMDMHFWDVARFGDWADKDYSAKRAKYGYEHRQSVHYPYEEVDVARGLIKSAIYDKLVAKGAVHGVNFGMEYPLWYAPEGTETIDKYDFERGNWFDTVKEECEAVRERVGFIDVSYFGKYHVTGTGAVAWLDKIMANKLPAKIGKTILAPMLNVQGRIIGDYTITRLGEESFLMLGSGIMQASHKRWWKQHLPEDGSVTLTNSTHKYGGIQLAGPRSRELLQKLTDTDVGPESFKFLSGKTLKMSGCDNVTTIRVSFSGELGYELYCPTEDHVTLYDAVVEAGEEFGLAHVGSRALGSMRIEKAFSSWGTELSPDYTPFEAGIDFFVRPDGRDFIGRDAFLEMSKKPVKQKLCQLVLEVQDKDCFGGEAIYCDCKLAGYVTSAAYGHYIQKSLALGYIRSEFLESDNIQIDRLGEMLNAKISKSPIYDPPGGKMRS